MSLQHCPDPLAGFFRGNGDSYVNKERTRNILDCDQSNVFLAHYFPADRRKDLGDIFHISRVIANFSSNFVAMATRVGRR